MGVTDTASALRDGLKAEIEQSGYYPALVFDSVIEALGDESVSAYVVHHDATFDRDELRRHLSALVLTPTRLIVGHTDEFPADDKSPKPYATAVTEAVSLESVNSIVVSRAVSEPAQYRTGAGPFEVMLTIGWGAVSRVELEPAGCGDPTCEADHGFTGSMSSDDVSLRVSRAGDGDSVVEQVLAFARALSKATGR